MPAISPLFESKFPQDLQQIMVFANLPGLADQRANPSLRNLILAWEQANLSPNSKLIYSTEQRDLILAGLWLLEGDLDASHQLSQAWETPNGSYWHAIMHRREGDFSNSKYWYRRTKKHPAAQQFQKLILNESPHPQHTAELIKKNDLTQFLESWVDLNQQSLRPNANSLQVTAVAELAWLEWQVVMQHTLLT